jgi:hypothetical protein
MRSVLVVPPSPPKSHPNIRESPTPDSHKSQPAPAELPAIPIRLRSRPRFPTQIAPPRPERSKNVLGMDPRVEPVRLSSGFLHQDVKKIEEAIIGLRNFPSRHQHDLVLLSVFEMIEQHFAKLPGFRVLIDFLFDCTFIKTSDIFIERCARLMENSKDSSPKIAQINDNHSKNTPDIDRKPLTSLLEEQFASEQSRLNETNKAIWTGSSVRLESDTKLSSNQHTHAKFHSGLDTNIDSSLLSGLESKLRLKVGSTSHSLDRTIQPLISLQEQPLTSLGSKTFKTNKPSTFNKYSVQLKEPTLVSPVSEIMRSQPIDHSEVATNHPSESRATTQNQFLSNFNSQSDQTDSMKSDLRNHCAHSTGDQPIEHKDPMSLRGLQSFKNLATAIVENYAKLVETNGIRTAPDYELSAKHQALGVQWPMANLFNLINNFEDSDNQRLQNLCRSLQATLTEYQAKLAKALSENEFLTSSASHSKTQLADAEAKLSKILWKHSSFKQHQSDLNEKLVKYKTHCHKLQTKLLTLKEAGTKLCGLLKLNLKQLACHLALDWSRISIHLSEPPKSAWHENSAHKESRNPSCDDTERQKKKVRINCESSIIRTVGSLSRLDDPECKTLPPVVRRNGTSQAIRERPVSFISNFHPHNQTPDHSFKNAKAFEAPTINSVNTPADNHGHHTPYKVYANMLLSSSFEAIAHSIHQFERLVSH